MKFDLHSRMFLALAPWFLPIAFILPYAFVASDFRGLVWVWESGYKPFWFILVFVCIMAGCSSFLLFKLQDLGRTLFQVAFFTSTAQLTFLAMTERRHSLLLLIFLLFSLQVYLSEKMKKVLTLPFFDSKRKWWEGCPKGIPGLRVELFSENGDTKECRLSNFGPEGCFVFSEAEGLAFTPKAIRVFQKNETLLEADVEPVIFTNDGFGCGLRFNRNLVDGDWIKDLEDYLGHLRRAGYEVQ
jgi:hypothetical protein